jgi:hypothetical protein
MEKPYQCHFTFVSDCRSQRNKIHHIRFYPQPAARGVFSSSFVEDIDLDGTTPLSKLGTKQLDLRIL